MCDTDIHTSQCYIGAPLPDQRTATSPTTHKHSLQDETFDNEGHGTRDDDVDATELELNEDDPENAVVCAVLVVELDTPGAGSGGGVAVA